MAHSIIHQPGPKLDLLFERGVDARENSCGRPGRQSMENPLESIFELQRCRLKKYALSLTNYRVI